MEEEEEGAEWWFEEEEEVEGFEVEAWFEVEVGVDWELPVTEWLREVSECLWSFEDELASREVSEEDRLKLLVLDLTEWGSSCLSFPFVAASFPSKPLPLDMILLFHQSNTFEGEDIEREVSLEVMKLIEVELKEEEEAEPVRLVDFKLDCDEVEKDLREDRLR